MKFALFFLAFSVLVLSFGCNRTVKYKTVNHYSVFDVEVPENFEEIVLPNSIASFQLGNRYDDFYLTISSEGVEELMLLGIDYDLGIYSDVCLQVTNEMISSPVIVEEDKKVELQNDIDKKSYSITGFDEHLSRHVFYYLSFLKSNSKYYSVITWCADSYKSKHIETMKHIHSSFKEK